MADYSFESRQPHELSNSEMNELIEKVREAFIWYAPDSCDHDIAERLRGNGASVVDLVLGGTGCVGFSVTYAKIYKGARICYRAGTSLLPQARGQQLYIRLIEIALAREAYDYLATRTQNPRVYETLRRFANGEGIYPSPDRTPTTEVLAIAQLTCESGTVEPATLIVRDAHGFVRQDRSFMTARDPEVQHFFSTNLGRDDGFMVVVPL